MAHRPKVADLGYAIVVHFTPGHEAEETVQQLSSETSKPCAQADLGNEQSVAGLIDGVVSRFGRLTSQIVRPPMQASGSEEHGQMRLNFEVNMLGTFLCQKAGLVMVRQPEGGNIILLGTGRDGPT